MKHTEKDPLQLLKRPLKRPVTEHIFRTAPNCMKMNRFNRFYKWARSLSVGSERARRYSLPDLPRGDQLPAFLARSARPWQTPRHRRARVRRTPCAHMQCPALPPPAAPCVCCSACQSSVPAPGVSTASPGAMDASMLLSPAAYWAHAASGSTAWTLVADSRSAAAGVRDHFATGADSARNRSGGRW